MRHATVFIMTVFLATTLRSIKLLIDCTYDVSHSNLANGRAMQQPPPGPRTLSTNL